MATTRRPSGHQGLNDISKRILLDLRQDFTASGRPASDLQQEYEGLSLPKVKDTYLDEHGYSEVDFDLALKELEDHHLVGTGPHAVYDNDPGSSVVVLGFYSKREYVYLKEAGYRAASEFAVPKAPARPAAPRVTFPAARSTSRRSLSAITPHSYSKILRPRTALQSSGYLSCWPKGAQRPARRNGRRSLCWLRK